MYILVSEHVSVSFDVSAYIIKDWETKCDPDR